MAGVRKIFGATALNGGTGALSNIASTSIEYGDLAIAQADSLNAGSSHAAEDDALYFYRYANSTATPDATPKVVKPNNLSAGQSGRWLLISPAYFMEDLTVEPGAKVVTNEIISNGSDLTLSYTDGTVYITVGDNLVTVDAPTVFAQQVTSAVLDGTPPFIITSTTEVANLNAQYVGGEPITNISVLDDNTQLYAILPRVEPPADFVAPTYPQHPDDIATKAYVDNELSAPSNPIHHGGLVGLEDDDHTQYALADGTRAFTGEVGGVDPTVATSLATAQYVLDKQAEITDVYITKDGSIAFTGIPQVVDATIQFPSIDQHLATKKYVDDQDAGYLDHGGLTGLGDDDHTQYMTVDGDTSRTGGFNTVVSGQNPTDPAHLTTKFYVDNQITGITDVYIVKNASIAFSSLPRIEVVPDTISSVVQGGSGYTTTPELGVATSGGTGTGLTVDITTDGDAVLTVVIAVPGTGYTVGDTITILGSGNDDATFTVDDGVPVLTPSSSYEFVTKEYADGLLTGGSISHGSLLNLDADDHAGPTYAYVLASGTRAFTGTVDGVAPTDNLYDDDATELNTLVTKGWVKAELTEPTATNYINHSNIANLTASDDHTQYVPVDCSRPFDTTGAANAFPYVSNDTINPDDEPTFAYHLTTKKYVDDTIQTLSGIELIDYVDVFGRHAFVNNQRYIIRTNHTPFINVQRDDLVNKYYVDSYTGKTLVSVDDRYHGFFNEKIETDDANPTTSIYDGVDTGVVVEKTDELLGGISYAEITDGGTGFFMYDSWDDLWIPQTFDTDVWSAAGVGSQSITETNVIILSDTTNANTGFGLAFDNITVSTGAVTGGTLTHGGYGYTALSLLDLGGGTGSGAIMWILTVNATTGAIETYDFVTGGATGGTGYTAGDNLTGSNADLRVEHVVGDVEYIQVQSLTSISGDPNATYEFTVIGDTPPDNLAVWSVTLDGAGTAIASIQRVSAGTGYSNHGTPDITSIPDVTGTFVLRPYVIGEITSFKPEETGYGYTSPTYLLSEPASASFITSGEGTTNLGTLSVTYNNPVNEKLKLSQYVPPISGDGDNVLSTYAGGYTRTAGQVISALEFDEYGNITKIAEAGTGGQSWNHHKFSVDGATLNATGDNSYWVHPDTGAVTVNLPAAPVSGTVVVIDDYRGVSATNNITVSPDASDYMEGVLADDVIIDVSGSTVTFTYFTATADTTFGWRYKVI
jgi:hypothetical protein